ncbi:YihY/virulence factor BrkB family protein [Acetobacterium carbinolicum]|jgi:membrane protein|uniref:YihY/virulence factor BrkB family protein n=1 Tax=Acetobacterium TaxID=33951 RepID=UPI000DBEBA36|nr:MULTISPECIES: YhjD/YihY/BrkB family envelope integrity protein [unclassified Acetobacterium]AWW27008.1 YihY/virulence factor BrkB family protein [Acetobacterium sp. KB-1]MDK2941752.1 rane protein [Acetobacterium sp.]MDZ5725621.1 YhjD/YihY/BrkB family envelope integrity protein [Acetobacterium sp. K1/6]
MIKQLFDLKIVKLLFFLMEDFEETDFSGICTQMSFYLLLAFFPLLLFLISFIGSFIKPFESYLYEILEAFLPNLSYDYVTSLLDSIISQVSGSHYSLILVAFFFSSLAARAIMVGINQTYGRKETRTLKVIWLYSFLFTILFTVAILLIAFAYLFSADVGAVIFEKIGLYTYYYPVLSFFAVVFSWIVSTFIFNMIYVMAPAQHLKFKSGLPGALFATLGLNIAFRIFTLFINHSTKYSTLYGSLGGLFALMVAIYFICVILNLGGKINLYWSLYQDKAFFI